MGLQGPAVGNGTLGDAIKVLEEEGRGQLDVAVAADRERVRDTLLDRGDRGVGEAQHIGMGGTRRQQGGIGEGHRDEASVCDYGRGDLGTIQGESDRGGCHCGAGPVGDRGREGCVREGVGGSVGRGGGQDARALEDRCRDRDGFTGEDRVAVIFQKIDHVVPVLRQAL